MMKGILVGIAALALALCGGPAAARGDEERAQAINARLLEISEAIRRLETEREALAKELQHLAAKKSQPQRQLTKLLDALKKHPSNLTLGKRRFEDISKVKYDRWVSGINEVAKGTPLSYPVRVVEVKVRASQTTADRYEVLARTESSTGVLIEGTTGFLVDIDVGQFAALDGFRLALKLRFGGSWVLVSRDATEAQARTLKSWEGRCCITQNKCDRLQVKLRRTLKICEVYADFYVPQDHKMRLLEERELTALHRTSEVSQLSRRDRLKSYVGAWVEIDRKSSVILQVNITPVGVIGSLMGQRLDHLVIDSKGDLTAYASHGSRPRWRIKARPEGGVLTGAIWTENGISGIWSRSDVRLTRGK